VKGCPFPHSQLPGGLRVAGFIDNTMNATCRPGGGPARDGIDAPRNDPLIQRAWYNGWKKLHGMKYQTVDLPNGMNLHVWGPISVRHNDIVSLHESKINDLLVELQLGDELQWIIYGDSAYIHVDDSHIHARHHDEDLTDRQILENRTLSACRECIEWDYGDIGVMWSMVDYKKILKMQLMPVKNIYLTAVVLRNAYVTMNGGTTAEYFNLIPPTFEVWTSNGPADVE
jgi:DDE superfamily endonuclease